MFLAGLNGGACFAGHCDWRLPTVSELESIVDCSHGAPCVAGIFGPTQPNSYWSSSSLANTPNCAWLVLFYDGYSYYDFKTTNFYVRAVRGGL